LSVSARRKWFFTVFEYQTQGVTE